MLPSWAKDTVTRLRPGTIDRRGSLEPDWSKASSLEIPGCSIQPGGTSLSQDGRVLAISDGFTGYFPPAADVQAGDRITISPGDAAFEAAMTASLKSGSWIISG